MGMPTCYHEVTISVKKMFEEIAVKKTNLKNKIGASFRSYGWSGEATRLILEIMEKRFEMNVLKPPFLIRYTPINDNLKECSTWGKNLTGKLKNKINLIIC